MNELAWKHLEPIFYAKKSAWVCSPWISKSYAERIYDLSRKGVEVRIITSDDIYNADTYSYLSQLRQTTNFDVHFVGKEAVHSKIYVVDNSYAVTGAVNLTYTGLNKQTNNFAIYEREEVEPIVKDFMRLWIAFKSENVRPTQMTVKNILPIVPYEKAVVPQIKNANLLKVISAKLTICPYYKVKYSLLEDVRLPWYQHTVVEDKGAVVIDASHGDLLNWKQSTNFSSNATIRALNKYEPLREVVLEASEKYEIENREWDVKVDGYKAEELAINYIKEKNRRNLSYNNRNAGEGFQPYVPSNRAITILSKDKCLISTWHFRYAFQHKEFQNVLLASSGEVLSSDFSKDGAICEDCTKSVSMSDARYCPTCSKWVCTSELDACSSCGIFYHKKHFDRSCSVCGQVLCDGCTIVCPLCKKNYGKNHSVICKDCGLRVCSGCAVTSGLILKKKRCPSCDAKSKLK